MGHSKYVHLENCNVLAVTDKAIHILHDGRKHWIPQSQVADPETYEAGDEGVTISITEWIAQQKDIEGTED